MAEIVIFGGTTEGRQLAEACTALELEACVCVVSSYGEQVLPASRYIKIHTGAMEQEEMERLLAVEAPLLVFDATHPHAAMVSSYIKQACQSGGKVLRRVLRQENGGNENSNLVFWVNSVEESIAILEQDDRPILITTGSKDLPKYTAIKNYQKRIYARVLASREGIRACEEIGLTGRQIIAMQGPFSQKLNEALLEQIGAGWLVTKESGRQGGFAEKLQAAGNLKLRTIVIGRPVKEEGISLTKACRQLAEIKGRRQREVVLIGIGMGSPELMTVEAVKTIKSCDALLGAQRMLAAATNLNGDAETAAVYLPGDVLHWLEKRPWLGKIGILLSGDCGFYSGAKSLREAFESTPDGLWKLRMLPGISTVSYLCARIGTCWDDIHLCSMHGRDGDLRAAVGAHARVFCLLDKKTSITDIGYMLDTFAGQQFRLTVGESLSYSQERIVTGTPAELGRIDFLGLLAVLIERIL